MDRVITADSLANNLQIDTDSNKENIQRTNWSVHGENKGEDS